MGKLKIFLSYHKKMPLYQSDMFEPIHVGAALVPDRFCRTIDSTGDNISKLNPYYCELTAYYWVLKNYLDNCEEEYIGFAHYRRLIDLTQITDVSEPAIFGLNYPNSVKVFNSFNEYNLEDFIRPYDIILPCKAYMYKDTVNPELRKNEQPIDMYNQFKTEHKSNLMDVLNDVINESFPQYIDSMNECFKMNNAHFYNIYVMKKEILKEFLNWKFEILTLIGNKINGWTQDKYKRMAGFVGERLINIWLKQNETKNYKIGYAPIYMIDFEEEYIKNFSTYCNVKRYDLAIKELETLLEITNTKARVSGMILELYLRQEKLEKAKEYFPTCFKYAKTGRDYEYLSTVCFKYQDIFKSEIEKCYYKTLELEPDNKFCAINLLSFCTNQHDLEKTYQAWQVMEKFELTDKEKQKYETFMKCYEFSNSHK